MCYALACDNEVAAGRLILQASWDWFVVLQSDVPRAAARTRSCVGQTTSRECPNHMSKIFLRMPVLQHVGNDLHSQMFQGLQGPDPALDR